MKKFLFTADWHLDGYSNDKIDQTTGFSERLTDIKNTIYNMGDYCRQNNIENFIIGGDLLHGKSRIHALALSVLLDFFRSNKNINFYVIDGNHDLSTRGREYVSALKALDNEPNINRIKKTKIINNIVFVPYCSTMIDDIKNNSGKILISHFGLNEGMLNSGIFIVSDLAMKDLKNYEICLLGHYHKPQEISRENTSVFYVGSPTELEWGEKNEEKRFLVVDMEKNTIESVQTKGFRKHIELEINNENKNIIIETAKKLKDEGHYIQLKKIENVETDDLKNDFRIIDKTTKDITNRGISSSMTIEEKLKKYLEIREIQDMEEFLECAKNIISKTGEE